MPRLRRHHLDHGQARARISERLDAPLATERDAVLEEHLAACPDCRRAEAEYLANRAALRRLPAQVAPRDLPARTFAALEFEARRAGPARAAPVLHARGARRSGGVAIGSLLTVALVAIVGVLLAGPVVQIIPGPKAGATPFAIAPVNLAYVGIEDQVVRLYHARLDLACPAGSVYCPGFEPEEDQVVNLPGTAAVSGLTFDPAGTRAAITARSGAGATTTFYVVDLGGAAPTSAGSSAGQSAQAASSAAAARSVPPVGGAGATAGAAGGPSAAITGGPTSTPRPSAPARAEKSAGSTRAPTPHPVRSSSSDASAGQPAPVVSAAQASAALTSAGSLLTSGASALPSGEPALTPSATTLPSAAPPMTTLPAVEAQAILADVIPTGASPAWSTDGTTLAFSAMPADGSDGSDIYTWHPGDAYALALTTDHASTFASWAGDRIVGSTLVPALADPSVLAPQSFVLDPRTGEHRLIEGSPLWLPSVDPTGRYMVAWSGTLATAGMIPVPAQGQLVFAVWSSLDPFGVAGPGRVSGSSEAPVGSPAVPATNAPAGTPGRASTTIRASATTVPEPSPGTSAAIGPALGASPTPVRAPDASASTGAALATAALVPVDPSPVPSAPQLKDWGVDWSPDGSAFAVWEGSAVGVTTGTLSLHAVDETLAGLGAGALLLRPVAASRGFSIGLDRLAWTTPPDVQGLSEVQVLLWGSFGRGQLHSGALQQQGIVPAF